MSVSMVFLTHVTYTCDISITVSSVIIVEQNTRQTLRHAQWAYVLVLGQNRLEGTGRELLENDEVVDLYVGRLS